MIRHADLIEESRAFEKLRRDSEHGLLKHAYIFESADTAALETLAALFICLCEVGKADGAMLKRIDDGGYLDIVRLPRESKNGKMDVEEVTYLTDTAYLAASELKTKYYIISADEPLSPAVQNKMLKTLEEPPSSARFIIFSSGKDLLSTVTSRCSTVRLEEFSAEVIERELVYGGADGTAAFFAAVASRGNLGIAEKIVSDPGYQKAYESAMNFLLTVKRSPQILPAASAIAAAKEKFGAFVDYLELILRDVMAYRECGPEAVVLKPATSDIITLSREFDTRTCLAVMPLLTRARERTRSYGNALSCIDELLFSILEVKAKCLKS